MEDINSFKFKLKQLLGQNDSQKFVKILSSMLQRNPNIFQSAIEYCFQLIKRQIKLDNKMLIFYLIDKLIKNKNQDFINILEQQIIDPYFHFYRECFSQQDYDNILNLKTLRKVWLLYLNKQTIFLMKQIIYKELRDDIDILPKDQEKKIQEFYKDFEKEQKSKQQEQKIQSQNDDQIIKKKIKISEKTLEILKSSQMQNQQSNLQFDDMKKQTEQKNLQQYIKPFYDQQIIPNLQNIAQIDSNIQQKFIKPSFYDYPIPFQMNQILPPLFQQNLPQNQIQFQNQPQQLPQMLNLNIFTNNQLQSQNQLQNQINSQNKQTTMINLPQSNLNIANKIQLPSIQQPLNIPNQQQKNSINQNYTNFNQTQFQYPIIYEQQRIYAQKSDIQIELQQFSENSNSLAKIMNKYLYNSQQLSIKQKLNKNGLNDIIIKSLYDDLKFKCGICQIGVLDQQKLDQHYDWHFQLKRKEYEINKKGNLFVKKINRKLYSNFKDFINCEGKQVLNQNNNSNFAQEEEQYFVETKESQVFLLIKAKNCKICQKNFEIDYNNEIDSWILRKAILLELEEFNDVIVHYNCWKLSNNMNDLNDQQILFNDIQI